MKTRMEKYYDEDSTNTLLRQKKNENLYNNMDDLEVEDYKLNTNVTVLDNNAKNIDVEQIKKILDTKYNQTPKRRSIVIEDTIPDLDISLDETREYDINAILKRARDEKEVDYEKERVKKLRDTQFDILNSLDLDETKDDLTPIVETDMTSTLTNTNIKAPKEEEEVKPKKENDELLDLINTITMRELEKKPNSSSDLDPLDILTDLKGSEDTVVINGARETESIGETSPIMSLEEADKIKPQIMEEKKNIELTNTLAFTQSDFDDFDDLKKEVKSNRALIYVAIILVSLVLIACLVIFLNKFLNLSLW